MALWIITTKDITEMVEAPDQHGAYEVLREAPAHQFGLIVTATPSGKSEADAYSCRTSLLLGQWGRIADARQFISAAIAAGLGDTSDQDLPVGA